MIDWDDLESKYERFDKALRQTVYALAELHDMDPQKITVQFSVQSRDAVKTNQSGDDIVIERFFVPNSRRIMIEY